MTIYKKLQARVFSIFGLFIVGLAWSLGSLAAPTGEAIENAIDPYPRAEVVDSSSGAVADYRLATDAARNVGDWGPEQELRKAGELSQLTMQIPEGHGPEEVFDYYLQQMDNLQARAIYLCRERNCGSSNAWANNVFEEKQLYGLDQAQYYGIFEVVDDRDRLNYVVIYTVARGNRRVYAHLEWLETDEESTEGVAPKPDAITEQLRDQDYYNVSGSQLEGGEIVFQAEHIDALASALRSNRRLSVRIVGHDYSRGSLEEQMERSREYAQQLAAELAEAGVSEDRLEAHGVGSLVPTRRAEQSREKSYRLEIVIAR